MKPSEITAARLRTLFDKQGSELDVIKFIINARKLTEVHQDKDTPQVRKLRFYLSIPLHARLKMEPARAFLEALDEPVQRLIAGAALDNTTILANDDVAAVGKLVSFEEMRSVLANFISKPDIGAAAMDDLGWASFVTRYVGLVSESGTTIMLPRNATTGLPTGTSQLVEARVTAPLIPDENPKHLSWDWRFKLRNGDTLLLRHNMNMDTFLEQDSAIYVSPGVEPE